MKHQNSLYSGDLFSDKAGWHFGLGNIYLLKILMLLGKVKERETWFHSEFIQTAMMQRNFYISVHFYNSFKDIVF